MLSAWNSGWVKHSPISFGKSRSIGWISESNEHFHTIESTIIKRMDAPSKASMNFSNYWIKISTMRRVFRFANILLRKAFENASSMRLPKSRPWSITINQSTQWMLFQVRGSLVSRLPVFWLADRWSTFVLHMYRLVVHLIRQRIISSPVRISSEITKSRSAMISNESNWHFTQATVRDWWKDETESGG